MANRRWQTSRVSLIVCEELILRDHAFLIGHEEALLKYQQDLLRCSKLSEFLNYLRGVEGSYVTFYHLKVWYDWDTQCAKAKIREHKHTIWNATKNMTTKLAATLILGNLWNEMWKFDHKDRWLKCSCTCLSFNITQLYIWVMLNLLAHIFKKEVVDTYQLKNLIELEADFDLFYFREKNWFWGTKIYTRH